MFLRFLCVLLLLSLTLALTDREIIQQTLNGMYEQNKLDDPTTITDCDDGDDDVDHEIVVFIGTTLEKAAKASVAEIFALNLEIKNFINSLPPLVTDCIYNNSEFDELLVAYNLKDPDISVIEKKVIAYFMLHFLAIHKWLIELDNLWYAGNYYQTGFNGAGYVHKVLAMNVAKQMKQMRQTNYS